jgi:flagellar protein FliO/FliZ
MSSIDLLQAFIPLVLILALLYGVLFFIKRKGFRLNPLQSKINGVEVLSTQTIMPKKFISLIKVQDKVLLVGMTDNNMTLLKEFDYEEDSNENEIAGKDSFSDIFKKNLGIK